MLDRSSAGADWQIFKSGFALLGLCLAFMVVVLPNSNRAISLPLFATCGLLSLGLIRFGSVDRLIWAVVAASAAVTTCYLTVGTLKEAYAAIPWVLFVYVVGPAVWTLILSCVFQRFARATIFRSLIWLTIAASLSVYVFYAIFFTIGPAYLTVFIAEPNVDFENGQPFATMHVFGSLLFLCGGFFSAPQIIVRWIPRTIVFVIVLGAVTLSGRSAVFVSVFAGALVALAAAISRSNLRASFRRVLPGIVVMLFAAALIAPMDKSDRLDLSQIPYLVIEKIGSGGGEERIDQAAALRADIGKTYLLGAGHGVGASYLRDYDEPWRYEMMWLSTIYKVGLIGTLIYLLPVLFVAVRYLRKLITSTSSTTDDFMFGGVVALILGVATNPYLESFEFQWMMVLPFVFFAYEAARIDARRQWLNSRADGGRPAYPR